MPRSTYHSLALAHYSEDTESISTMLLTIMEMRVACDTLACRWHHLLSDYDPGVPCEPLQSLILPRKAQMERLRRVETYLQGRRSRAEPERPHIFSSFGQPGSFAVRYVEESVGLQDLQSRIQNDATRERNEKRAEFRRLQGEYRDLMARYNNSACTYTETVDSSTGNWVRYHDRWCSRCNYLKCANDLSIEVHEWPPPQDAHQARSVASHDAGEP